MLYTQFAVTRLFKLLSWAFTLSADTISLVLSEFLSVIVLLLELGGRGGYNIIGFFNHGFSIDQLYNEYALGIVFYLEGQITNVLDKDSVELGRPYGLEIGLHNISSN